MKYYIIPIICWFTIAVALPAKASSEGFTSQDTTKIKLKKTKILVISLEDADSTEVLGEDWTEIKSKSKEYEPVRNWNGIDIGFNLLLNPNNTLALNPDFVKLNYSRSINWSINFAEQSVRLKGEHIKLTTGLGLQFYNYEFEGNYTLQRGTNSIQAVLDTTRTFGKNRLKSTFINAPLLLSFNSSEVPGKGFHFSTGVIVGYKLGSRLKQTYEENNEKFRPTVRSNFNLNPFQVMPTVRMGYRNINVFANYDATSLFLRNEGPALHAMSFGLSFLVD